MGIITNKKIIYVFCPANIKTGGPELLHQLVYTLNNNKNKAYITYFGVTNRDPVCQEYKQYVDTYKLPSDVIDSKDNLIIIPETNILISRQYKKIEKAIWWLSVDNFYFEYRNICALKYEIPNFGLLRTIKRELLKNQFLSIRNTIIKKINYNLCQSEYAMDFCKKNKLQNIIYLSDYINDDFVQLVNKIPAKENIIAYNPSKGVKQTRKIVNKLNKKYSFIPIRNMTRNQVLETLAKAKIYIDFGNHPGKDRIPREAVCSGCCILTNEQGSANHKYKDVEIPIKFKIANVEKSIKIIDDILNSIIINYDEEIKQFYNYRQKILNEKKRFILDCNRIFN
jgi:hypothetical protein